MAFIPDIPIAGTLVDAAPIRNNLEALYAMAGGAQAVSVLDYGTDVGSGGDDTAAFIAAAAALTFGGRFYAPPGKTYHIADTIVFTTDLVFVDIQGTVEPFAAFDDYLFKFSRALGPTPYLNVGQVVVVENMELNCNWQCRGVRFESPYNSSFYNIKVFKPYGTAISIDGGYECDWYHPFITLGKRRAATWSFTDWSSVTAYTAGQYVRRTYAAYNSGTTYAQGAQIVENGHLWRSLVASNLNNTPSASPDFWRPVPFEYFLCKINNTNKDPHDPAIYTTNSSVVGDRYWQMVYYDEAGFEAVNTIFGIVDLQRFWMLNIRDSDYQTKIRLDNNLDDRLVVGFEFYGLDCENISAGIVAASGGELVQDDYSWHIQLGRTYRTVIVGGNLRMSSGVQTTMIQAGFTAPGKTCLALKSTMATINGNGTQQVGIHWMAGSTGAAPNYMQDLEVSFPNGTDALTVIDFLGQNVGQTPFPFSVTGALTTRGDFNVIDANAFVTHTTLASLLKITGALTALVRLRDTSAGADQKVADLIKFGSILKLRMLNDAETVANDAYSIVQDASAQPAAHTWYLGATAKAQLEASNGLTLNTGTNLTPLLRLLNTDATEPGAGPALLIDRLPVANPTGPYEGGYIYFRGKDDTGATQVLVELTSYMDDPSVAGLTSKLVMAINFGGNVYKKVWNFSDGIYARLQPSNVDLPHPGTAKINALGYHVDDYEAVVEGALRSQGPTNSSVWLRDEGASANAKSVRWFNDDGVVSLQLADDPESVFGTAYSLTRTGAVPLAHTWNVGTTLSISTTTSGMAWQWSDDGAGAGPVLDLYRVTTTPAINDLNGIIQFNGRDSAANKQLYGAIDMVTTGVTSGAEVGLMRFHTAVAGTTAARFNIQQGFYANGLTDPGTQKANMLAYNVSGTQVVAARDTGWVIPTGTQSKATFDTATVTTEQLAQRVFALEQALFTHGLIGT